MFHGTTDLYVAIDQCNFILLYPKSADYIVSSYDYKDGAVKGISAAVICLASWLSSNLSGRAAGPAPHPPVPRNQTKFAITLPSTVTSFQDASHAFRPTRTLVSWFYRYK